MPNTDKVQKVFFVTVFDIPEEYWDVSADDVSFSELEKGKKFAGWTMPAYRRKRTWGFFLDYATAERSVLENWTDMYEQGYYNLALIEEVEPGICIFEPIHHWFKVEPIYNEDAIRRDQERARLWEESNFFGKRLGQLLHRYLVDKGHDLGSTEIGVLVGSIKTIAEKIGMDDWMQLYKIQAGEGAPKFTEDQWSKLMECGISAEEEVELKKLQWQALKDPEHHGKPVALKDGIVAAARSTTQSGPETVTGEWTIKGYDVSKCEMPKRFGRHGDFHTYSF